MKHVYTREELLKLEHQSIIENSKSIMMLDGDGNFHQYKKIYIYYNGKVEPLDYYIDVDFLIYCTKNKIKLN